VVRQFKLIKLIIEGATTIIRFTTWGCSGLLSQYDEYCLRTSVRFRPPPQVQSLKEGDELIRTHRVVLNTKFSLLAIIIGIENTVMLSTGVFSSSFYCLATASFLCGHNIPIL
tara:strand:+ start:3023 stop:3361 length:339 start_codon:yes stop_codon:yes gene_type:complete